MRKIYLFLAGLLAFGAASAQVNVTFNVDISATPPTGIIYLTGSLATPSWSAPGTAGSITMTDANADNVFTATVSLAAGNYEYKFFQGAGWTGGEWIGKANRTLTVGTTNMTVNCVWGDADQSETVLGVDRLSSEGGIYPNPSKGIFNLPETADFQVMDITGKTILSGKGTQFNLTNQMNGVYFVKVTTNTFTAVRKIIKN